MDGKLKRTLPFSALLLAAVVVLSSVAHSNPFSPEAPAEKEFVRVEVFSIPMMVLSSARLSPKDVRNMHHQRIVSTNPVLVNNVKAWMRLEDMKRQEGSFAPGDARLVIDLYDEYGERTSYYASYIELYSENSIYSRPIGFQFRSRLMLFGRPFMDYPYNYKGSGFENAHLYFCGWNDDESKPTLSPESARSDAGTHMIIRHESLLTDFVRWLDIPHVNKEPLKKWKKDVRLVIDLEKRDGSLTSFYATRFFLYSGDFQRYSTTTDVFKAKFLLFDRH